MICIENYDDDDEAIEEVLRNMPGTIYAEYQQLGFPGLPAEHHPDYVEPEEPRMVYDDEDEDG